MQELCGQQTFSCGRAALFAVLSFQMPSCFHLAACWASRGRALFA